LPDTYTKIFSHHIFIQVIGANLDTCVSAFLAVTFIIAALAGILGYIAKFIWLDLRKARNFAILGIIATIAFLIAAMIYL
jgi:hypothetical protein